ncbi:MAG TPA: PIN domain-containing protein [Acidobacteriaceae bacterium]
MTITAVADTDTALWHLFGDVRLSTTARQRIQAAALAREKIAISTITLAEIVYLVEKNRIAAEAYEALAKALIDPEHVFVEAVFTAEIVKSMRQIPRDQVPDLPDRIIAATALYFAVPVISRDNQIAAASVTTVW